MTAPLAIVRSADGYDGLLEAFRRRAEALNSSRDTLSAVSGLSYLHKLLMPRPKKGKPGAPRDQFRGIGQKSLGPTLGTLGLMLLVVEDEEMLSSIAKRLTPRGGSHTRGAIHAIRTRKNSQLLKGCTEWGRLMSNRWMLSTTPTQRKQIARHAAKARWAKRRKRT